ncbi:hypothetical protein [Stenotrophomonas sp. JAI102]|uniref:hypothetical protein n=1 Tax=Stenotrophomonas sp. JAI102 TaxID=2723077 RepID=UPI0017F50C1C|nr:hypothetical protein [Stenotrophomonas sp. JAI102]NYF36000.1 hypothetical protein [Stenotrophomonas sp. JAI102]
MTETTAVYVDGYNFYYGRIRGTPYKWIDVVRLFERLVHEQTPTSQMTLVRYFSAFCLARFSTHGNASTIAQDSFLRGHEVRHGSRFQKTMGTHTHDRSGTKMPRVVTPRRPPEAGAVAHRNMMSSLSANAHWARSHIHDEELASCQLPDRIQTGKKPIDKPAHW